MLFCAVHHAVIGILLCCAEKRKREENHVTEVSQSTEL